jgi:hypothetical protein
MRVHRGVAGATAALALAFVLVLVLALVLAGCGSSGKTPQTFTGPTYTASEVVARFAAVTGMRLQRLPGDRFWIDLASSDSAAEDPAYGVFSISVLKSPRYLTAATTASNRPTAPDSDGIYWTRVGGGYPGWSAAKVYGNLVLSVPGVGKTRTLPSAFANLNRILSTLSEPVSVARTGAPSVPRFSGTTFTAPQVATRFQAETGYTLSIDPSQVTWDTLQPSNPEVLDQVYGIFTIDVLHSAEMLSAVLGDQKHPIRPDAQGIYWTYDPHEDGGWTANKVYGNVVLQWTGIGGKHRVGSGFHTLDRILSGLAEPAAAAPGVVPTCQAAGIRLVGTKQGTCLDDAVKLIVVNRSGRVALGGYAVTVMGTRITRTIRGQDGAPPTRAKGEFVIATVRVTNTGSSPLTGPVNAELVTSTQDYQADGFAEGALIRYGVFPLRRGASATTNFAFDVPPSAAAGAVSGGALLLPYHEFYTVQTDSEVGVIHLG